MSKWKCIVDYINFHEIIYRKDLIKYSYFNENYLRFIKHSGFIEKTGRGKYKKLYNIPEYISTSIIFEMSINDKIRKKYLSKIIRKLKLDKIKNFQIESGQLIK